MSKCAQCGRPGVQGLCPVCQDWQKDQQARSALGTKALYRYFEFGAYQGSVTVPLSPISWNGTYYSPCTPSLAYVCPECGELWGRAVFCPEGAYRPLTPLNWAIETRRCAKHGDGFFLVEFSEEKLRVCSKELLRREVLLLMLRKP